MKISFIFPSFISLVYFHNFFFSFGLLYNKVGNIKRNFLHQKWEEHLNLDHLLVGKYGHPLEGKFFDFFFTLDVTIHPSMVGLEYFL